MTENEILTAIDNNDYVDTRELVYDYEIEREEGEKHRWYREIYSICQVGERFFQVTWNEGLTECQDNDFEFAEIVEVELHEYEKTITVREWKEKK